MGDVGYKVWGSSVMRLRQHTSMFFKADLNLHDLLNEKEVTYYM